jgi:hypothetical protein
MVEDILKRKWKIWVAAAVVVVVGIVWWGLREPEPSYEGKTVNEWFSEIDLSPAGQGTAGPAFLAIKAMGTNAIPFLRSKYRETNSKSHIRVAGWLGRFPRLKKMYDDDRYDRAYLCLLNLGADAQDAAPELIEVSNGKNWERVSQALFLLSKFQIRPDLIIPLLMKMLQGDDQYRRWLAVKTLAKYGPTAKLAVQVLVSQWRAERKPGMKLDLGVTIRTIDPDAAAREGIR